MDHGIERVGPRPLTPGRAVTPLHQRTPEEREAFERTLDDANQEAERDERARDLPELGEREPDEAGGQLDLLG